MDITNSVIFDLFVKRYLDPDRPLDIIDIGSYDVNGTYKESLKSENWHYMGLDIREGPNVDVIAKGPYDFSNVGKRFDVVVSGSTMEHVEDLKLWVQEVAKLLKPDAFVFFSAPCDFPCTHPHPKDCWRIFQDGMSWLMKDVMGLQILELFITDRTCFGIGRNHGSN